MPNIDAPGTNRRRILIEVNTIYSTSMAAVIAEVPPIQLLVREVAITYGVSENDKADERAVTNAKWQEEWENEHRVEWTRIVIPDVRDWVGHVNREANHFFTQFLTGHGSFRAHLVTIGK
ncbi:uncharacterized protein [Diabrotica undecimpunctata]|uniref:uncharacterized protein n=1 Tax=Diabrotica undecimpunctata TaxID=50387 RepID=UPI003B641B1D